MKRIRFPAMLVGAAMTSACITVGPDYERPAPPPAANYAMTGDLPAPTLVALTPSNEVAREWWRSFASTDIDRLVEQALRQNRTLAAADAALARAQAVLSAARGGAAPQIDYSAGAERERVNTAAFGIEGFPSPTISLYSVGASAAFDLDVFGGQRRRIESAAARAEAQARRTDAAYLSLSGQVVTRAVDIGSLQAQLSAAEGIVADDRRVIEMIRRSIAAGGAPASAETAAAAQLAEDEARLPPLRIQLAQARHALAALLGHAPSEWAAPELTLEAMNIPERIPVSLPSELVRARPDILAAEADLHAATADIGVATAALYPRISLGAAFSVASLEPETLFNYESAGWSFGPSLTGPLFHGGALRAQRRGAQASQVEAMARYEQTVLNAFVQVSDLLQAVAQDQELVQAQIRAAAAAAENARLAELAYENGAGTLLQVIDAQRQSQRARLGLIQANAQLRRDIAALFVATASDWRAEGG